MVDAIDVIAAVVITVVVVVSSRWLLLVKGAADAWVGVRGEAPEVAAASTQGAEDAVQAWENLMKDLERMVTQRRDGLSNVPERTQTYVLHLRTTANAPALNAIRGNAALKRYMVESGGVPAFATQTRILTDHRILQKNGLMDLLKLSDATVKAVDAEYQREGNLATIMLTAQYDAQLRRFWQSLGQLELEAVKLAISKVRPDTLDALTNFLSTVTPGATVLSRALQYTGIMRYLHCVGKLDLLRYVRGSSIVLNDALANMTPMPRSDNRKPYILLDALNTQQGVDNNDTNRKGVKNIISGRVKEDLLKNLGQNGVWLPVVLEKAADPKRMPLQLMGVIFKKAISDNYKRVLEDMYAEYDSTEVVNASVYSDAEQYRRFSEEWEKGNDVLMESVRKVVNSSGSKERYNDAFQSVACVRIWASLVDSSDSVNKLFYNTKNFLTLPVDTPIQDIQVRNLFTSKIPNTFISEIIRTEIIRNKLNSIDYTKPFTGVMDDLGFGLEHLPGVKYSIGQDTYTKIGDLEDTLKTMSNTNSRTVKVTTEPPINADNELVDNINEWLLTKLTALQGGEHIKKAQFRYYSRRT